MSNKISDFSNAQLIAAQSRSNFRSVQGVFQESFALFQESHFGHSLKGVYNFRL